MQTFFFQSHSHRSHIMTNNINSSNALNNVWVVFNHCFPLVVVVVVAVTIASWRAVVGHRFSWSMFCHCHHVSLDKLSNYDKTHKTSNLQAKYIRTNNFRSHQVYVLSQFFCCCHFSVRLIARFSSFFFLLAESL